MGQLNILLSLTFKIFTLKLGPIGPSKLGMSASFTRVIDMSLKEGAHLFLWDVWPILLWLWPRPVKCSISPANCLV